MFQEGNVTVEFYKQGLPRIFKDGEEVEYYDKDKIDFFDFEPFYCQLDRYIFHFWNEDKPYVCEMTTPSGNVWRCEYDYAYGAGFGDADLNWR